MVFNSQKKDHIPISGILGMLITIAVENEGSPQVWYVLFGYPD